MSKEAYKGTVRLTVAQAIIRFLSNQYTERDGVEHRLIAGAFGIFGHGNVAGIGQALLQNEIAPAEGENPMPYIMTATTNRLPVLIFPSDQFATRIPDPVLQQLEDPTSLDVTVNDAFRPVSRFFDRINRPEQLIPSLLNGMRVLTDPAETGAVTIALPQDVQAEAYDWPVEFFAKRVWHVRRPPVERAALERAVAKIRAAKRPLIIAGGGAIYSEADFTTASKTQFKNPDVSFVNINITPFDAAKQSAEMVVADAREALVALTEELADYRVDESYTAEIAAEREAWAAKVEQCYHVGNAPLPAQTEVFGALNELMGDEDVVINAAGSMPGDLQALWQAKTPVQYHVEYAFSCMGYEVPAAMGVKLARPESEVVSIVGDGTYQMLPMELATVAQEGIKVIYVLLQNYGFASIGALSESRGSQRFGTKYRQRGTGSHLEDTDTIAGVDIAANARSWGIDVLEVQTIEEFKEAYKAAAASDRATMIHIETDLMGPNPPGSSWWDVAISEVSVLESTQRAYEDYQNDRRPQRHYL